FSMMQLGSLHAANKEFELSNKYFRKAEPLFEQYTTPYDQNTFKINYAFALSSAKKYAKAITTYKDALKYYEKENMLDDMTYCYEQLAFCYEQAGDFKNALVFMKKFRKTSQQVDNESVKVKLNELNLQYETEKKERQILQQKNELIEDKARFSRYQSIFLAGLLLMGMALFIYRYFAIQRERKLRSAFQSTFLNVLQLKEHFEGKGSMSEKIEITTEVNDLANRINTDLGLITADIDSKLLSSKSFNYTVSHELKRYLSQLEDDISEIGIQSKNNSAVAESLEKVSSLKNLTSKLLELSSIEKETLKVSRFDLRQLVEQCLDELQIPKTIAISLDLTTKEIQADRLFIRQAITNLLENAVKYTQTTSDVIIEVISRYTDDNKVEITIMDNGKGITDATKREQIFEAFFQAENAKKGNGLGLAIVKKIIEKHDGYVFAQQNKPTGLKVGFGIPIQS
ncbi:MAG: tetratricopeptide repeat-containing sensor histidine kinase, partial [Spirosomaceae bacterium]|nr:tetratricopeptide repeat-containing sensor histidine kinase [Spirosomataceae bacterium]